MTPTKRTLDRSDMVRMNLPEHLWTTKVSGVCEAQRAVVDRYLVNLPEMKQRTAGLYVIGAEGVGKTAIGVLICKEARSLRFTAFFTPVWELREGIRSHLMFDESTSLLDRCREVDFLVLDGLSADDERDFVFGSRAIEDLILTRSARRRVTIVTTRLSAVGGASKFFSRLQEVTLGCMVSLLVTGPNQCEQQNRALKKVVLGG